MKSIEEEIEKLMNAIRAKAAGMTDEQASRLFVLLEKEGEATLARAYDETDYQRCLLWLQCVCAIHLEWQEADEDDEE